ncbi:transferase activity, transferring glycosyl groups protein [[Candida] boidinii]|nr:transferase activity, transferring glycosyl groups protein [[Candida] boidinii]
MSNVPDEIKKLIGPTIKRANEIEQIDPAISYFCKLYASELVISEGSYKSNDKIASYAMNLLDEIEKLKNEFKESQQDIFELISDKDSAHAHTENFAISVFNRAFLEVKNHKTTKLTPDKFMASVVFMNLLKLWSPIFTEEIEMKIKYAKFHAARILKAFRSNQNPNDYTPPEEEEQEEQEEEKDKNTEQKVNEEDEEDEKALKEFMSSSAHVTKINESTENSTGLPNVPTTIPQSPEPNTHAFNNDTELDETESIIPHTSTELDDLQKVLQSPPSDLTDTQPDNSSSSDLKYPSELPELPTVPHDVERELDLGLPSAPVYLKGEYTLGLPTAPTKLPSPSAPELPSKPSSSSVNATPSIPQIPSIPSIPQIPQIPQVPHIPQVPQVPQVQVPQTPQVSQMTQAPRVTTKSVSQVIPPKPSVSSLSSTKTSTAVPIPQDSKTRIHHMSKDEISKMMMNDEIIVQAQKRAKFAISALNYEDIPTAIKELEQALKLLKG